ncbi:DUF58 domain-containing protein [uncultured Mesonia sp.]|uniref:DUF58 domain-containing protein n=1 Tax=uncultured Mesonia sp. TaxID=399731 RepID=UPI00374F649A
MLVVLTDGLLHYKGNNTIEAKRLLNDKLSNGDVNKIQIKIKSLYNFKIKISVIDEIPFQFQKRDFYEQVEIAPKEHIFLNYSLLPTQRGVYKFGAINIFVVSPIGLIKKRFRFAHNQTVKVYPSIQQLKKYDFIALQSKYAHLGLKKIRRIGHTLEFEQIKEYVIGDDIRSINWKATAKQDQIMVNQYQDEKSQPVYCVIDTSRVMKMPFSGLKLLDYAINSSLALSNIALKKKDKVGLITYEDKVKISLPAKNTKQQLQQILERLYGINTNFRDSDFSALYAHVSKKISQRSLLLLYTNFEHISALERQLPYLKALNKKHVLVVIFFNNTELEKFKEYRALNLGEIYEQTIAAQFIQEKKQMQIELSKHGIQCVLTNPQNLSINTINKYLEIKAKHLL